MATTKFKNTIVNTCGDLPSVGDKAPLFTATNTDLSTFSLKDYVGKKNIVLNVFPSIDTSVCAASVRKFNKITDELKDTLIVCISKDLPFAHKRFCGAEGINNVITVSEYKDDNFSKAYGVKLVDGPLEGLMARSVFVIDKEGIIRYVQLVDEITNEPDYDDVVNFLKKLTEN